MTLEHVIQNCHDMAERLYPTEPAMRGAYLATLLESKLREVWYSARPPLELPVKEMQA